MTLWLRTRYIFTGISVIVYILQRAKQLKKKNLIIFMVLARTLMQIQGSVSLRDTPVN